MSMLRAAMVVSLSLALMSCGDRPPPSAKDIQSRKAQEAADSINFSSNAEIENIKAKLELTSKPGLIGYIVLLNETGQPIYYGAVKGKLTSSGKRLTSPDQYRSYQFTTDMTHEEVGPAPSDEGTWGSSDPYIYFWTIDGAFMQWNGKYLYSNSPIRLSVQPLIVSLGEPEEKIVPDIVPETDAPNTATVQKP